MTIPTLFVKLGPLSSSLMSGLLVETSSVITTAAVGLAGGLAFGEFWHRPTRLDATNRLAARIIFMAEKNRRNRGLSSSRLRNEHCRSVDFSGPQPGQRLVSL